MVQSSKTFRIFVSSTFSDLKEERNILQKYAFPRLRELCAQHGFKFQAIDLRWGVSEEAGLDQQTMKICLEEIERSQRVSPKPNFIVLLGNRYGWRPLPAEIEAEEFNQILEKVSGDEEELLLWNEEQPENKKGWYRLDENAVPAVYCLQPRKGIYEKYEKWTLVEQRLHSILLEAASKLNLGEDEFLKYYASATEQEIVHGALKVEDAKDHVFCFFRNIENLPENKDFVDLDQYGNINEDTHEKLENLKDKLRGQLPDSHIKEYDAEWADDSSSKDHLEELYNDVYKKLEGIILEKIEEIEEIKPLDQEIEAHEEFGKDRAKFFTGRTEILNDISEYLENGDNSPLTIYGESGSGKSALMAKAVIDAKENYPNAQIISRFIGATPDSSDIRSLLESLCEQLRRIYGESESEIPSEYNDLVKEFTERLKLATKEKHLFIFLDALDQLSSSDNAHSLNWLPDKLPDNVYMAVSSLNENFYDILKNKIPEENLLKLEKLNKVEGEDLLKLWLKDGKITIQQEQWNEVINKFQIEGLPLYLKLAFEEVKNWKSYTKTPELESDIPGIIRQMFNRLSDDSNHGKLIVDRSLGYLAASKNGLSEDEIIDVLSRDKDVFYDFIYRARSEPTEILNAVKEVLTEDEGELKENSWNLFEKLQKDKEFCFNIFDRINESKLSFKLPVAIWSRLYFDLEPYLTERSADETSLLAFYHRQLGEFVAEEFLKDDIKIDRHNILAKYFQEQKLQTETKSKKVYNLRKISELPYQETYSELWGELERTLTDLNFIKAKCEVGMIYNLIEDYDLSKLTYLDNLKISLMLSAHVITNDINQLWNQLKGRIGNKEFLEKKNVIDIQSNVENDWICPNFPSLYSPESGILNLWRIFQKAPLCQMLVSNDDSTLAIITKNKISFWNLKTGSEINYDEGYKIFDDTDWDFYQKSLLSKRFNVKYPSWDAKWVASPEKSSYSVTTKIYQTSGSQYYKFSSIYQGTVTLNKNQGSTNNQIVLEEEYESKRTYTHRALISANFSHDQNKVFVGGVHGEIKIWDLNDLSVIFNERIFNGNIVALAPSSDDKKIVFLSENGFIGIFDLNQKIETTNNGLLHEEPENLYISFNGEYSIVNTKNDKIFKINTSNGNLIKIWDLKLVYMDELYQRDLKISYDFNYAVINGFGPDIYDGWYIGVIDLNTEKPVFSKETSHKNEYWSDIKFLLIDEIPYLYGLQHQIWNNETNEWDTYPKKEYLVNLNTGGEVEKKLKYNAAFLPWLDMQKVSENGITCEIIDNDYVLKVNKVGTLEDLLFTPEDKIAFNSISKDGSCIGIVCESGQLHFLSIKNKFEPFNLQLSKKYVEKIINNSNNGINNSLIEKSTNLQNDKAEQKSRWKFWK